MLLAKNNNYNKQDILDELLIGSGVVVIKDVYNSEDIQTTPRWGRNGFFY